MNKLLVAAALSLVLAAPAMAQPDQNRGNNAERHETHRGNRADNNDSRPGTPATRPAQTPDRPAATRPDDNRQNVNRRGNDRRPDYRPGNDNRSGVNRPDRYERPGVRPHARRDYSKYRRAVTAPRRFRIGTYHAPRGYSYRRWNYGQYLPSAYWGRSFWLSNFMVYGLFAPPPDTVWVRYGPDAMLVDRYTGEIISVQYNVFY